MTSEQDRKIAEAVRRDRSRLLSFIRKRLGDAVEAEDVLQDVFYQLVEAERLLRPVEQVTAWLFRVARNRIIDVSRKKQPEPLPDRGHPGDERLSLEDLLPSREAGPEAAYARSVLLDELQDALDELPEEQRAVFVAHEWEGRSFKELASETGVAVNTLLSRKHAAVRHLRRRLRKLYDEIERN